MKTLVVGLGIQGKKRLAVAGKEVVATVDPRVPEARYRDIQEVPLEAFDAALVCTPDQAKLEVLRYLLAHGKHVLVEKPLLAESAQELLALHALAQDRHAACYTAYNHRFEPHLQRLKALLHAQAIGQVYSARMFYGNGTAADVKRSPWRDQGLGVLSDLGSHLLDLAVFLFGRPEERCEIWAAHRFENRAYDHVSFGSRGAPALEFGASLVSWWNTFTIDVFGEQGSVHVNGLCKWGPSTLTLRKRVFPSGRPEETPETLQGQDQTWALEYRHFTSLCRAPQTTLEHDAWICDTLNAMTRAPVTAS